MERENALYWYVSFYLLYMTHYRYLYILESREDIKSVEELEDIDFKRTFNINYLLAYIGVFALPTVE